MDTVHPTKLLGIKPSEVEQKRLYIVLIKASLETVKTKVSCGLILIHFVRWVVLAGGGGYPAR